MKWVIIATAFVASCANQDKAEEAVRAYAAENFPASLGYAVQNAKCQRSDSDNDGYCSCNLAMIKDGKVETPPVECPCGWVQPFADICRAPKMGAQR